jgi:hypothetical protein
MAAVKDISLSVSPFTAASTNNDLVKADTQLARSSIAGMSEQALLAPLQAAETGASTQLSLDLQDVAADVDVFDNDNVTAGGQGGASPQQVAKDARQTMAGIRAITATCASAR